jgi:parvulin-like peptidyl-prolyl isomerase
VVVGLIVAVDAPPNKVAGTLRVPSALRHIVLRHTECAYYIKTLRHTACAYYIIAVILAAFFFGSPGSAAEPPGDDAVVATVGGEPILAREVRRFQEKAARGKSLSPETTTTLQAQVLEEIVSRRLVLAYAKRMGEAATKDEIDQARGELKTRLAAEHKTLDDFLKEQSATADDLERQLAWNVVWEKYLAKYVTPERIQKFFDAHRREFDGTELLVSHVLLAAPDGTPAEKERGWEDLAAKAKTIREDILAGTISFADAVEKYSTGPSRSDGGKLGTIGRLGPMDVAFTRAAFALNTGEISPPVRTPFGVHLIRCDEVRPGKKQLADVESEVRDALARELMEKLAQVERPGTTVTYSDKYSHLDPASRALVKPKT